MDSYHHIAIDAEEPLVSHFFLFLQQGVSVRCRVGCSVMTFLRKEMDISPEIIEKIQSIFLDGAAVDDLESAVVKDGSVLALSAAMPGLVGATLRRGGRYSSFRSAITYHEAQNECVTGEGLVRIKIFNLLMAELGPRLLRKGVIIESQAFISFTAEQPKELWQGCREILLDGRPMDAGGLRDKMRLLRDGQIMISVSSDKAIT